MHRTGQRPAAGNVPLPALSAPLLRAAMATIARAVPMRRAHGEHGAVRRAGPACAALLVALWPAWAAATGTLDFEAGGYGIALEIGDDTAPQVARVRLFPPGDATGIALRPQDLRVDGFDIARRRLRLRHLGTPGFELRVEGDRGVLEVDGRRLPAPFDWQM